MPIKRKIKKLRFEVELEYNPKSLHEPSISGQNQFIRELLNRTDLQLSSACVGVLGNINVTMVESPRNKFLRRSL